MSCHLRESLIPILAQMAQARRPRLLLRTARLGLPDYARERDLKRLLRLPAAPAPGLGVVQALLRLEGEYEALRTRPPADLGQPWRAAPHIEVLIALLAEARLLAEALPAPVPHGADMARAVA